MCVAHRRSPMDCWYGPFLPKWVLCPTFCSKIARMAFETTNSSTKWSEQDSWNHRLHDMPGHAVNNITLNPSGIKIWHFVNALYIDCRMWPNYLAALWYFCISMCLFMDLRCVWLIPSVDWPCGLKMVCGCRSLKGYVFSFSAMVFFWMLTQNKLTVD